MISEISAYRQKKVDQLLRNLDRCNKIIDNIQKIDSYMTTQMGGATAVATAPSQSKIAQITSALQGKRSSITEKVLNQDVGTDNVSVKKEDLEKMKQTMAEVQNLVKEAALLAQTNVEIKAAEQGTVPGFEFTMPPTAEELRKKHCAETDPVKKGEIEKQLNAIGEKKPTNCPQPAPGMTAPAAPSMAPAAAPSMAPAAAPSMAPAAPSMAPAAPSMAPAAAPSMAPAAPSMAPSRAPAAPSRAPSMAPVAPSMAPVAPSMAPVAPSMAPAAPSMAPVAPSMAPAAPSMAPAAPSMAPSMAPAAPSSRRNKYFYQNYF